MATHDASRDYFSDLEAFGSSHSPAETTFLPPRPSSSRRSSRHPRADSNSPPPLPSSALLLSPPLSQKDGIESGDFDPDVRSITPTLSVSLVARIHALERELESKIQFIGELEGNLANTKVEKDELVSQLARSEKERRTLRKQFQQVEHGTIAALEELAKDRDDHKASSADFKAKVDVLQTRHATLEKDNEKLQMLWTQDKDSWKTERQTLERKAHVAETRLKNVLDELAAQQHGGPVKSSPSDDEENTKDSGFGEESENESVRSLPASSPAKSHRKTFSQGSLRSVRSLRGYRISVQSLRSQYSQQGLGMNLADELDVDDGGFTADPEEEVVRFTYADSGVQYSRPATPVLEITQPSLAAIVPSSPEKHDKRAQMGSSGVDAVDRGQQFTPEPHIISHDVASQTSPPPDDHIQIAEMVSAATQTMEEPLNPSTALVSATDPALGSASILNESIATVTSSPSTTEAGTQTDLSSDGTELSSPITPPRAVKSHLMNIPEIVIDSPRSAPPSPREPILPPRTRSTASQTTSDLIATQHASVQTEEIRLNKELLAKLPPHLHPDALLTPPKTSNIAKRRVVSDQLPLRATSSFKDRLVSSRASSKASSIATSPILEEFPSSPPPLPSPTLTNSTVADKSAFFGKSVGSPASPTFATPAPNKFKKSVRSLSNRPSPVPEEKETDSKRSSNAEAIIDDFLAKPSLTIADSENGNERQLSEKSKGKQPMEVVSTSSIGALGRRAIAQHSIVSRSSRSRTPSNASAVSSAVSGISGASGKSQGPPFAIPDRNSSKKLFAVHSKSEGSSSPTPRGNGSFPGRRGQRGIQKKDSLRKIRSHNNFHARSTSKTGSRTRSPPVETDAESPTFPPLPKGAVTFSQPEARHDAPDSMEPQSPPSTGHANIGRAQQGSVVDAIAKCMVGEKMYKYVRKRNSLGISSSHQDSMRPGTDGTVNIMGTGARHERWVWISPFEKSILWSSKQPQSESALMGKNGRKLVVNSAIDLPDHTPLPRNHDIKQPFNRSILILTPHRALKFTAKSLESHTMWMNALNFLTHSAHLPATAMVRPGSRLGTADGSSIAQPAERTFSMRKAQFRDSLRLSGRNKQQPVVEFDNASRISVPDDQHEAAPAPTISTGVRKPNPTNNYPDTFVHHGLADTDFDDSAEPPTIPRYNYHHSRKRSVTTSRIPSSTVTPKPVAYGSVATPRYPSTTSIGFAVSIGEYGGGYGASVGHVGGATAYVPTGLNSNPVEADLRSSKNSEATVSSNNDAHGSERNYPYEPNSVGTISMEAFVAPSKESEPLPTIPDDGPLLVEEPTMEVMNFDFPIEKMGLPEPGFVVPDTSSVRPRNSLRSSRTSAFASRLGNNVDGGDARRSGIVYPDDFDAFDPFKNF